MDKILFSSDRFDWSTPRWLFDRLDEEFQFTLDVCAQPWNAKCEKFFTEQDDALNLPWFGSSCWMNPPYGKTVIKWVEKAYLEVYKDGHAGRVCCLLPARTDTRYWWEFCVKGEIRFIKGRLKFELPTGERSSAPFPSAVVIFEEGREPKTLWDIKWQTRP